MTPGQPTRRSPRRSRRSRPTPDGSPRCWPPCTRPVLAAVAAVATRTAPGAGGLAPTREADIALVLLDDRRGRRAMPVFPASRRWPGGTRRPAGAGRGAAGCRRRPGRGGARPGARPGRAGARRPGSGVRRAAAAHGDRPGVRRRGASPALRSALGHEPAVAAAWIGPGAGVDARLSLVVAPDQDPASVADAVAGRPRRARPEQRPRPRLGGPGRLDAPGGARVPWPQARSVISGPDGPGPLPWRPRSGSPLPAPGGSLARDPPCSSSPASRVRKRRPSSHPHDRRTTAPQVVGPGPVGRPRWPDPASPPARTRVGWSGAGWVLRLP